MTTIRTVASTRFSVLLVALVALVAFAAAPLSVIAQDRAQPGPAKAPLSADAQRVVEAVRTLFAAAERGDLTALDTLYAGDSLTVVEGAGINRGWPDYRDHHLAPELKEMKNFRYRPYDIEARVSGNLAWAMFSYGIQAEMGARTIDQVGRGTAILELRGTRWVVRHTQTSSRVRRATDPPFPK